MEVEAWIGGIAASIAINLGVWAEPQQVLISQLFNLADATVQFQRPICSI